MKNENYINIQGWMINELELKGNELILYALIYGFTQDGQNTFKGSISYIREALRLSNRSVVNLIKKLVDKKLIKKTKGSLGNEYQALVKKVHSEESSLVKKVHKQPVKKVHLASEKSSHNNNKYNNINNNNIILHSESSSHGKKINEILCMFKKINPTYKELFKNKTQRKAIEWLIKEFSEKKIINILNVLPEMQDEKYCPTITTPLELKNKFAQLIAYGRKRKEEQNKYKIRII